jgi:predicted GNAT family N-acyltransferase
VHRASPGRRGDRRPQHRAPTHAIEADGQPVLAAELRSVAFGDAGYAYVARGTPHVQIWRSTTPVR